ncbi:MAG: DUF222 domain-containing protein [Longimicrobiales bacterium]
MRGAGLAIREMTRTPYGTRRPHTGHHGLWKRDTADGAIPEAWGRTDTPESVDVDTVEALGDQIATLSAHIHAATHRLLVLIADFDRRRGWELAGYSNCARWLAARTGIDLGAAREKVRAARALEALPMTSAAMARGELSFSQLRALSRVADAESEPQLLELARGTTTAQLERMVRAWKAGSRKDEAEWARERHCARTLSVFPGDDGMYVVTGRLTPEVGALLMRAIEAASDALYREERVPGEPAADSDLESAQRRADAVALLAERALAAGFGAAQNGRPAPTAPISGTCAERYQVLLHVDAETLSDDEPSSRRFDSDDATAARTGTRSDRERHGRSEPEPRMRVSAETLLDRKQFGHGEPEGRMRCSAGSTSNHTQLGRSELEDGTRVSAETSRRMTCDASVVRVVHRKDGSVLDIGRKTRTISPALRRALEARDRGCRFPGCHLRFCDAHHVVH